MRAAVKALIVAFIFLTRLPMPRLRQITPADSGRALACFPLVGLALGGLLFGLALLLGERVPLVGAALLLAAWAALTGALHLDGLGDSADGWLGGYGDRARTLEIMKDPRAGSAAVVVVGVLLLLKFAALASLLQAGLLWPLLLAPALARAWSVALFMVTPYAREQGLGTDYIAHAPRRAVWLVVLLVLAAGAVASPLASLTALLLFVALRRLMLQRLGGTTGDTAGALTEIIEAGVLCAAALSLH